MGYPEQVKKTARKLRAKGKTFSEIKKQLGLKIPKSTVSDWCSDVKLPKWYSKKLALLNTTSLNKAQKMSLVSNQIKRERFIKEIRIKNKEIIKQVTSNANSLKVLLAFLYLGEGAKWKSHRGLMLGSSNPIIINLYINLLKKCYGIMPNKLKCRISYRADQNIKELENYWSRITSVPSQNFYKTKPDPRTIGKITKNKDYKGVCVVTCAGTDIQLELEEIVKIISRAISSFGRAFPWHGKGDRFKSGMVHQEKLVV